jgi:sulfonate transport system substrate-binding protein
MSYVKIASDTQPARKVKLASGSLTRRIFLALTASIVVAGTTIAHAAPVKLRMGYQKYGSLILLKSTGALEKALAPMNVEVSWVEFNGGLKLLEGINLGSIDFGVAGDAPPILAQAAGAPLVYVGYEPPAPAGEAVIVPQDSPIKSIADLKGKKVAMNKGGNTHYLIVKLLEKNGLKADDIVYAWLPPSDARPAFERGGIDAWAIWDPFLADVSKSVPVRTLGNGSDVGVSNTLFYMADAKYAKANPAILKVLAEEIRKIGDFARDNPEKAAAQMAPGIGMNPEALKVAIARQGFGFRPMDAATVKAQQDVADVFYRVKVIPAPIKVQDISGLSASH